MAQEAIAIIGVALRLPDAHTLDELHENLTAGRDSVRAPAEDRVRHAGGVPGAAYVPLGYLDRVDLFDHQFFGLSLAEAQAMDPHQRLGLHLVHEAVENAGYAPGRLRGSATAVIVAAPNRAYASGYQGDDPNQILGSLPAAMAARIAYLFDFAGPALVVDTACSGSLAAVALAVEKLRAGRADLAVAGGVALETVLHLDEDDDPLLGVMSQVGVCRPFDAAADGTTGGEGGGFVLLKRLSEALADGDHVHAVLRGVAVNHNGAGATSMSAPSARAQAAAIRAAWQDAGVSAAEIGYVECHGSGTPLGDVVEADGLHQAFDRQLPPVGAVKGNFGHLDHAAGMAGLFKVLAGFRHSALYPTVHYDTPNPLFPQPIPVQTVSEPWRGAPLRAGLSSFGLTGTNVHAVLEQAPARQATVDDGMPRLVTVSARTPTALERYAVRLAAFLDETDHGLAEVAFALNAGRDDHAYRWAFTVHSTKELAEALREAEVPEPVREAPAVLLFSGDTEIDDATWADLAAQFPVDPALAGTLLRQRALYGLLGLPDARLVGSGHGNLAVRLIRGKITEAEALERSAEPSTPVNHEGLRRAARGFVAEGAVVLEMGADGALSRGIAELAPELPVVRLLSGDGLLAALGRLYELGVTLQWNTKARRIEAPTYPFEPVSCWHAPVEPVDTVAQPASSDVTESVAGLWAKALKAPDVRADSDYFALGGTSIAGIGLLREIESRFGARLTFADLYANRTVGELAALIEQRAGIAEDWTVPLVSRAGRLPLSINQEQLWYIDQLTPGTALYNIPTEVRYGGPLDRAALQAAFADLVERHEIMHSRIALGADGRPEVLLDAPRPALRVVDLSAEPERLAEHAEAEGVRGFDLAAGPLVRAVLYALSDVDHLLVVTWHHIAFDGWTPRIFLRDLSEFYRARLTGQPPELPELPIQYVDFAAWQRNWLDAERMGRGLAYWRSQLAGLRPRELPLDRPRPEVESHAGALLEFTLPREQAVALREFSRQEGVTTFVTMMAVMDALMHLWAGHRDVVVGAATSGRTNPATHELIGYFNNLLPFRTTVDGAESFRQLVRRCAATVTGVLDHEEIPFGAIVADLHPRRDASRHPVFTVAYTHQNTEAHPAELAGLTASAGDEGGFGIAPGTAKLDLTIGLSDQDGGPMRGYLEYATDLFDEPHMRRVVALYTEIVAKAMADPDRRLADYPDSVWSTIRAHAPEHPALVDGENSHSYGEICRRAEELAARLRAEGAGPVVPVLAERGVDMVVGWLAVLAADRAFVPLDPAAPDERTEQILADVGAPMMIVGTELRQLDGRPEPAAGLAYVAFTSGSTGRPQGCAIGHESLLNFLRWHGQRLGLSTADHVGQTFSAGFDGSVAEILSTLYHGATLHLLRDVKQTPATLLKWFADNGITVSALSTPMTELLLNDYTEQPGLVLRSLWTGGDRLRVRPPAGLPFTVLNMYGPTECTIAATCSVVSPRGDGAPDIGHPITGAEAYILDGDGKPLGVGEIGELYLGGAVVGRGYHRQPGLTAARFVADPFSARPGARMYRTGDLAARRPDGAIDFHGRADRQIALRGFRVEPAEVERVLVAQPGVREALVLSEELPSGGRRLVAHVAGEAVPAEPVLLAAVSAALPAHMVPGRVIVHDTLPKTANGKFDRASLNQENVMTTAGPVRVLSGIWSELLGREQIGLDEDFFQIGGDSVLSVGLAARAARAGVSITPQDVLRHPTLRGLSAVATTVQAETEPVDGTVELTPMIRQLLDAPGSTAADFVVIEVMDVPAGIDADALRTAVQRLTEAQEPLRYRFHRNSLGWRIEPAAESGHVFDTVVLPPLSRAEEHEILEADKDELLAEIDIQRGPLLRARFYQRGPQRGGVLLLLVHHFVHDEISAVPMLEDLNAALSGPLEPRPAAWRAWSRHLVASARSDELAGELTYWTSVLRGGRSVGTAPLAAVPGADPVVRHRTVRLGDSASLLTLPGAPSREAAVAAVARAWSRWRGTPNAFLSTVGHGAPNTFRPMDRSRSVGWFTNAFPLLVPVQPEARVRDALPAVADTLRAVPNDGVGYGILRQLSPATEAVQRLRALPEPQLLVEHKVSGLNPFRVGAGRIGMVPPMMATENRALLSVMPIIVATAVIDGELQLYLAHHGRFDARELSAFVEQLVVAFAELAGQR
ncbi:condensation domain-containing protein [Kutzneria kofuensis]|uniref:Amino acid adenylation domain-containing protein n=1 Tax=Kutzneria kofuensis TaxID=103725 RepID=A0A7W9KSE8_9PSEU|nr:condensation domain-containing protein [Kutzneria kofuensis]MBB5897885.1 amino acid adenylation domain-containing protein [Kutzneria kofuensis]